MTKFMYLSSLLLAVSIIVGNQSQAQLVYSTDFNSPLYTDAAIIGQDGWAITGTSTTNPISVANTATNGNVSLTTTGQDVNRTFTPFAVSNLLSIDYSAEINVTAAQTAGDYFMHLGDGGTSNFWGRLFARASTNPGFYQLAMTTSSVVAPATPLYGADLAIGSPVVITARYDIVSGLTNDTGELFVNGNPYVAAVTTGTDAATSFSSVNFRQGTAANAATVTIDNVSVNVTAIPEPASALLLGLGLIGFVGRRRK
jgi:hypothetical protein